MSRLITGLFQRSSCIGVGRIPTVRGTGAGGGGGGGGGGDVAAVVVDAAAVAVDAIAIASYAFLGWDESQVG